MRVVLALALFAFVVVVVGGGQIVSAGLIYQQTYVADYINHPENFFCNGTPNPVSSYANFTAGECNNLYNNATSFTLYCDGGNAVIRVVYSYGYCDPANVTSISRIPTVCGAGSTYAKYVCSGKDTLPNGLSFPPSGQWAVSSIQYNNTWDGSAYGISSVGTCGNLPSSARAVTIQVASYVGCQNYAGSSSQTPRRSRQSFHGGFSATYIDFNCKEANLYSLTQGFGTPTCINGVTGSGITGGPDAPTAPINYASGSIKASRTYYSKTGDSNFCGTKLATTYYANTCFDSTTVKCINGLIYTESNYGLNTDGACLGGQIAGYPMVRNTSGVGSCVQSGNTDYGFSYSCSTNSPSSSSSTGGGGGGGGGTDSSTSSHQSHRILVILFILLFILIILLFNLTFVSY